VRRPPGPRAAPRAGRDGAGAGAGVRDLDVVDRLDPAGGRWIRGSPMRHPRSGRRARRPRSGRPGGPAGMGGGAVPLRLRGGAGFGAGVVRGRVYVFGGNNGLECLGSVESLDPREGKWRAENSMLYHRSYPGTPCLPRPPGARAAHAGSARQGRRGRGTAFSRRAGTLGSNFSTPWRCSTRARATGAPCPPCAPPPPPPVLRRASLGPCGARRTSITKSARAVAKL
jgi:hypothetical protein